MKRLTLALFLLATARIALADFAIAASPPRFELGARAGETQRQVLEITNAARSPATLAVRTADWELTPEGTAVFQDELKPGSCRPWVAIERRQLVVQPGQSYRFRFEVAAPAGQAATECRFALLLEGTEAASINGSPPLTGRVGVIVYVAVGDARPDLQVTGVRYDAGAPAPRVLLTVHNAGNAHGRLDGFVTATDAQGRSFEATPASTPILAGETRPVALALTSRDAAARPVLPLTLRGKLEWGRGRSTPLDQRIAE